MLIKLKKDWTAYKAGQVVDVFSSAAMALINENIGVDIENKENNEPLREKKNKISNN